MLVQRFQAAETHLVASHHGVRWLKRAGPDANPFRLVAVPVGYRITVKV